MVSEVSAPNGKKGVAEQLTSWPTGSRTEKQQEGAKPKHGPHGHTLSDLLLPTMPHLPQFYHLPKV
jgi:hypothetical protein